MVIGLPDEDLGARVHAIVEPQADGSEGIDEAALSTFLADRLVRYKHPRSYEFTDKALRDDAGKVRRAHHAMAPQKLDDLEQPLGPAHRLLPFS